MLVHYIFVRKDLPLGVIAAMVTHAAGESAALYEYEAEAALYGDCPIQFEGATAVVLEAVDEPHLYAIATYLNSKGIVFTPVHEEGGFYHGQFMAIGVVPGERETLAEHLQPFQLLRSCKTDLDIHDPEC